MNRGAREKRDVQIGSTCIAKVSGVLARLRITRESPYGGRYCTNPATGREVRIRGLAACASPQASNRKETTMTAFAISTFNNIAPFVRPEAAQDTLTFGATAFISQKDLMKLTAGRSTGRLVEFWNRFSGVALFGGLKPVKKFTDRKTALGRIWHAV